VSFLANEADRVGRVVTMGRVVERTCRGGRGCRLQKSGCHCADGEQGGCGRRGPRGVVDMGSEDGDGLCPGVITYEDQLGGGTLRIVIGEGGPMAIFELLPKRTMLRVGREAAMSC